MSGNVFPQGNKEMMSHGNFEVAMKKVQMSMESISKDMTKQIESLQSEMEESLFFHELDDTDDTDGTFDEKSAAYSFASFQVTGAALAKAEETNKKLTNEIKLSEKRSNLAHQRIALSELIEKDLQYRSISLEQMMSLYQQRFISLEQRSKYLENENIAIQEDRDRASQKLQDSMKIVTESINHVESLEAKLEEKEVSLKLTHQLFSNASEEAKAAKKSAKTLQASLSTAEKQRTAAETAHAAVVNQLRNALNDTQRENKSQKDSIECLESSSAQYADELTKKVSDLEAANALANEVSLKLTHRLSNVSEEAKAAKNSVKTLQASRSAAEKQRTIAEATHAAAVSRLRNALNDIQRENKSQKDSMKCFELSSAQCAEEVNKKVSDLETANKLAVSKLEESLNATKLQLAGLEDSLESEKHNSEKLQALIKQLEEDGTTLRLELESTGEELKLCQQTITEKDESVAELQSMLADNDEELSSISVLFEEYKSMNEESVMRALDRQEAELESKEQQLQDIQSELEKYHGYLVDMEKSQHKQSKEFEEVQNLMRSKDAELASLQEQLQDTKKSLEQNEISQKQLAENLLNLSQTAKELTTTIDSLEQKSLNQETKSLELQVANDYLKKELAEKECQFQQLALEKKGLQKDLLSTKSFLEKKMNEKEDQLQELEFQKEGIEKERLSMMSLLEKKMHEKAEHLLELELRNEEIKKDLLSTKTMHDIELHEKEDHFQQLLHQKKLLEIHFATTKSMLEVAHNELEQKGVTMDDMHIALSDNYKTISSLRVDLDRTRLQLSLAGNSVETIQAEFSGSLLGVDPRVATLQSSLDEAHTLVLEKNKRIEQLVKELNKARANEEVLASEISRREQLEEEQRFVSHSVGNELLQACTINSDHESDIITMKEEMQNTKQTISSLVSDRIALEESLAVLRHELEEKSLEVETHRHEKQHDTLQSSLVDACKLLSERNLQIAQLDEELERARVTEDFLMNEIARKEQRASSFEPKISADSDIIVQRSTNSGIGSIEDDGPKIETSSFTRINNETHPSEQERTLWKTSNLILSLPEGKKFSLGKFMQDVEGEHEQQVAMLESTIVSLDKHASELQLMLDVINAKDEANKDYIDDLEVSLAAATKINEEFWEQRVAMLKAKIESAENLAHERQLLLDDAKSINDANVEKLEASLTTANKTIEELQVSVSVVQKERSSIQSLLELCEFSLNEMKQSYEEKLEHEILMHMETKEELRRVTTVRENSAIYANREIELLKKQLKDMESNRDKMRKAVEAMIKRYSLLEQNLSGVEQDLHAKSEELFGWKQEAERVIAEKEDLQKYLEDITSKLEAAAPPQKDNKNSNAVMLHQHVDYLIKSLQKKEKEAKKKSLLLDQKESYVTDLVKSANENTDIIKSFEAKIHDRDEEMKYLNGSLVYLQKQIQAESLKYDNCAVTLEEFKIHAKELSAENNDLYNELSLLKKLGNKAEFVKTTSSRRIGLQSLSEKTQEFGPKTPSRTSEKAQESTSKTPSRNSDKAKEFYSKTPSHHGKLEKTHEARSKPMQLTKNAEAEDPVSPWSQARKNWEALKREKVEGSFTNKENRPIATNLQDDEFAPSRRMQGPARVISPDGKIG